MRNEEKEAKDEGEDESQEGGAQAGAPSSVGSVNWRQKRKGLLLWCCQAPDGQGLQSVPVLRCSPMSGEVNMSAGSIVSEAVHRKPLGDVNRIQLQGTKVEVLKCL